MLKSPGDIYPRCINVTLKKHPSATSWIRSESAPDVLMCCSVEVVTAAHAASPEDLVMLFPYQCLGFLGQFVVSLNLMVFLFRFLRWDLEVYFVMIKDVRVGLVGLG